MSQTLTISDESYTRLKDEACQQGFDSAEQYLERKYSPIRRLSDEERRRRREAVALTKAIQERLSRTLGMMPDSTDLVREDRER